MTIGYLCEEHGYVHECDVDESGERICPACGKWVRGLVGRTRDTYRSPPIDSEHAEGDIHWDALEYGTRVARVSAFDVEEAAEAAIDKLGEPQGFDEIQPTKRQYRN